LSNHFLRAVTNPHFVVEISLTADTLL